MGRRKRSGEASPSSRIGSVLRRGIGFGRSCFPHAQQEGEDPGDDPLKLDLFRIPTCLADRPFRYLGYGGWSIRRRLAFHGIHHRIRSIP